MYTESLRAKERARLRKLSRRLAKRLKRAGADTQALLCLRASLKDRVNAANKYARVRIVKKLVFFASFLKEE